MTQAELAPLFNQSTIGMGRLLRIAGLRDPRGNPSQQAVDLGLVVWKTNLYFHGEGASIVHRSPAIRWLVTPTIKMLAAIEFFPLGDPNDLTFLLAANMHYRMQKILDKKDGSHDYHRDMAASLLNAGLEKSVDPDATLLRVYNHLKSTYGYQQAHIEMIVEASKTPVETLRKLLLSRVVNQTERSSEKRRTF